MRQFAHEETQMGLVVLAFGDIDGGTDKTRNFAGNSAQRFDVEVEPAKRSAFETNSDFAIFGSCHSPGTPA